jgi:hypothetical protein
MMLTLAWLTVSLPYVTEAQQKAQAAKCPNVNSPLDCNEEEAENPFANTTEEKTSNSFSSLSEEYLHDIHFHDLYVEIPSTEFKVEDAATYIAFHGELIVPPPDLA